MIIMDGTNSQNKHPVVCELFAQIKNAIIKEESQMKHCWQHGRFSFGKYFLDALSNFNW